MTLGVITLGTNPLGAPEPADGGTSYTLTADAGTFTITGSDATLERLYPNFPAVGGSFTITGSDATLTYTQPGVYTITADAGSYSITGSPATLTYAGSSNWTQQNPDTGTWTTQAATSAMWDKQNPT